MDGFDAQSMGFLVPPISEALGISLADFGPVLASALVGLTIGAMLSGPIADRWGRRWPLILSTFAFGVFSIATTQASSVWEFVLFRFLTGLGLGGAIPNVVALASEFAPARLQPILVTTIFAGMPAGALFASVLASLVLPVWGWKAVLFVGGVLPIAIAFILMARLPESIRFLTERGRETAAIHRLLRRIAPDLESAPLASPGATDARIDGFPVAHLFTEGRAGGTVLLWIPFFMNLLILFFVVSWLPALMRQAGMPASAGVSAVLMFSVGGIIGTVSQGRLMKAFGSQRMILIDFGAALVLIIAASSMFSSFALLTASILLLGAFVQGAQGGLNVLAAAFYPTAIRSTGVGWALGIGRIGSIIGPTLGGALLAMKWTPQEIFRAGAIPAAGGAVALLVAAALPDAINPFRDRSSDPAHH